MSYNEFSAECLVEQFSGAPIQTGHIETLQRRDHIAIGQLEKYIDMLKPHCIIWHSLSNPPKFLSRFGLWWRFKFPFVKTNLSNDFPLAGIGPGFRQDSILFSIFAIDERLWAMDAPFEKTSHPFLQNASEVFRFAVILAEKFTDEFLMGNITAHKSGFVSAWIIDAWIRNEIGVTW